MKKIINTFAFTLLAITSHVSAEECSPRSINFELWQDKKPVEIRTMNVTCSTPLVGQNIEPASYSLKGTTKLVEYEYTKTTNDGVQFVLIPIGGSKYHFDFTVSELHELIETENQTILPVMSSASQSLVLDLSNDSKIKFKVGDGNYRWKISSTKILASNGAK